MDGDTKHTHPSYGMVQFNRRSNGRPGYLFGSAVTDHYHTVSLSISTGCAIEDDLGERRYRAERRIVEVELSAAQFAEAITTMNVGDGVPCTIRRLEGQLVDEPPKPKTDVERSHAAFEAKMAELGRRVDKMVADIDRVTEARGLSKAARKDILDATYKVAQEVRDNIPFYLRLFTEAAERIVTAKKAEADAWLTSAIHRAGVASLRRLETATGDTAEAPRLTAGEPYKKDVTP